jgi:hypothetical protein
MSTTTIEAVATGEVCTTCGEELILERIGESEFDLTCGCSCAGALC